MKQKMGRLRLILMSLLALTVCATATAFIGVNYGDSLKVSAASSVKTEVGEVFLDENGYRILDKKDYFNYTTNNDGTIRITGISEKGFKALDTFPYKGGFVKNDFAIVFPSNTYGITQSAFDYIPALKKVTFNDGFGDFTNYSFRLCGFTEVEIPSSVKYFAVNAFSGCNLENISVRPVAGVTDPILDATADGTALVNVKSQQLMQITTRVNLPALFNGVALQNTSGNFKVTSLVANLFSLKEVDTVTIPATVKSIPANTFWFANINTIKCEEGNANFIVKNNILLDKATETSVYFAAGENVVIPDDVTNLVAGWVNSGAKTISLPDTVITIDVGGGGSTRNLETIVMRGNGKNSTLGVKDNCLIKYGAGVNAGDSLVMGCANSAIPASVTAIGTQAFYYNGNITRVTSDPDEVAGGNTNPTGYTLYIPETVKIMSNAVFEFGAVERADLHSGMTSIYSNTFNACPVFFNPDSWDQGAVNYAGPYLMQASQALSGSYKVRKDTSIIATSAFQLATNVQVIKLPESVVNINSTAFGGNGLLTTLYLPSNLETVGTNAFNANTLLIAPSEQAYEDYKDSSTGILKAYASKLTYEMPATFTVAGDTIETKLLAGKPYSYALNEATGEWVNDEIFSVGGFFVNQWKNDSTGTVAEINASDVVPNDVESLSFTAYNDAGNKELEEITTLEKIGLEDIGITYGEIYGLPAGYNPKYMSVKYEGTDNAGKAYSGVVPPVNAGTYTIIISPNQGYKWHDGTIEDVTATLTIDRVYVEDLTWHDLNVAYDGRPHTPYATFVDEFTGKEVMLISQPHTDAGEHTVTVSAESTCNYYIPAYVENRSETFTITPHEVEINWVGPANFTYLEDEDSHAPDSTIIGNIKNFDSLIAGKYTVQVYLKSTTNNVS